MAIGVPVDIDKIEDFCRRWKVTELALFGSVVRGDFAKSSDVDVLVTFAGDAHIGLITLSKMERELSVVFGREVDLVTKGGLKPLIRDEVLSQAEVLYAA
jgi:predicted nucleotidyltransferase